MRSLRFAEEKHGIVIVGVWKIKVRVREELLDYLL
jgi:hypothetical protein